jgi:hypothetical protein
MKYLWNSKTDYHIHNSSASVPVHQLLSGWLDHGGWNRRCTRTFGGNERCLHFGRQTSKNRRRLDVDRNNVLTNAVYVIRIRAAQDTVQRLSYGYKQSEGFIILAALHQVYRISIYLYEWDPRASPQFWRGNSYLKSQILNIFIIGTLLVSL